MNKKLTFLFILLVISNLLYSQDIVKFVDGTEKKMKVLGSDQFFMVFKNLETQKNDTIRKSEIEQIIFVNGEVLNVTKVKKEKSQNPESTNTEEKTIVNKKEEEKSSTNERELQNFAISTDIFTIFSNQFVILNAELFRKKSSYNFSFGKGFQSKDLLIGADYRFYFNNPKPEEFYAGNHTLGNGFIRFLGSVGATGYLVKVSPINDDVVFPVCLGLSGTLTSGFYFAILGGAEYGMNFSTPSSDIYASFKLTVGYRFNKKK